MEPHQEETTKNTSETPSPAANPVAPVGQAGKNVRQVYSVGRIAVRVAAFYVTAAALWILISDQVLVALVSDHDLQLKIATVKGWAFVVVTAALLYFLLRRETGHWIAERAARDEAEAALRQSEERFQSIYHSVSDAIFIHDLDKGRILDVNNRMCEMFGCTVEEARAATVSDFSSGMPPYSQAEAYVWLKKAATGEPQVFLWHCRRKNRSLFWAEVRMRRARVGNDDAIVVTVGDITERMQAEAGLRASEQRLKFALEGANDGIWDVDMRTNTVELSPRGCAMFGYTPEEFKIAVSIWSTMVHPEDLAATRVALDNHLSGHSPLFEVEQRIRTKTGGYKWTLSRGKVSVRDATGQPLRLTGTHTDITARRQAELHVEHLNRVYAMLSETNQMIVRVRDPQAVFEAACRIAVNQGGFLLAWIGLAEEPTARPKLVAQAGATAEIQEIVETVLNGPGCSFNAAAFQTGLHAVCNDIARDAQAEFWREAAVRFGCRALAVFPLKTEGKLIGTFNFFAGEADFFDADELRQLDELAADISFAIEVCWREERRRRIEEANTRLATAVEQADEIMMVTSAEGEILYVNPAFEKVTGYTALEAVGRNPRFLQSGAHDAEFYRTMWDKLSRGEVWSGHLINKRKDGTRYEEKATISPVRDATGRVVNYVGVKRDVTQEMAMEARLRQAQKMEAIGTLAGGIAHDFNNILGAIIGYTELAKMDTEVPAVQTGLDEILRACQRAGDLVRQILTFSRQQEQLRRPIQLWPVIEEATKLLRAALPSTIEFHLEHSRDVPMVLADPTQIHQIVMNLCTNASHAMAGRPGWFAVKLGKFEADDEFANLHPGCRPGTYALLSVSDTGHGMDRVTLDRIFDPFFTTKPPGEGTGLGLAVVHGIVQNHEGIITVYSRPGEGTVFNVYFPAHDSDITEKALQSDIIPHGQGQRILVVDDEPPLVQMTERVLKRLGYVVETATNPVDALQVIQAEPARFDLVLTDLTMPGMTGMEFASSSLKINPNLLIIVMTGFFANLTSEQVRAIGIKEVLLKPITIRSLGETIDRVLKTKNSPSSHGEHTSG